MADLDFSRAWRDRLETHQAGVKLADPEHPLEVFVGANELGRPQVVVQSALKPKLPHLSNVVLVDRIEGSSGHWRLVLTLQDLRFTEVFIRLVEDTFARSASDSSEAEALRTVDGVFDEWRRLLRPRPRSVLSKEALRGLVGELWLLINRFADSKPMDGALAGWLGPLGTHQDFFYDDSGLHESKAIGPTMSSVKISSEFQLDALDQDLELIVATIADVAESQPGAINLLGLVGTVTTELDKISTGHDDLHARLDALGVDLDDPFYADQWFLVTSVSTYSVAEEFPSVRASRLDHGVERVTYQVNLSAIEPFRTSVTAID